MPIFIKTQAHMRELFDYDAATGLLRWRVLGEHLFRDPNTVGRWNTKHAGQRAGSVGRAGYLKTKIDGKFYSNHRIIWLWSYGEWPEMIGRVDHNPVNDRLSNLRVVTVSTKNRNASRAGNNTSGTTGVSFNKRAGMWRAYISVNRKQINLGFFDTKDLAISARREGQKRFGFHKNHGSAAA